MLERKLQLPEEKDEYQKRCAYKVVSMAETKIMLCRDDLEKLGEDVFLTIDMTSDVEGYNWLKSMPREEREDIICFLKKYPTLSVKNLTKHYMKESEFYPGV